MDQDLQGLPDGYASYLRLRRLGIADEEIARRLGVDVEVLPMMRRLAEEKLEALSPTSTLDPEDVVGDPEPDCLDGRVPDTQTRFEG